MATREKSVPKSRLEATGSSKRPEIIDLTTSSPVPSSSGSLYTEFTITRTTLLNPNPPESLTRELRSSLTKSSTRLSTKHHALLLNKQSRLRALDPSLLNPGSTQHIQSAISATLVFAQSHAGTAVCISSEGHILTCSHCIAESAPDMDWETVHWLLFSSGQIVGAKCIAWDARRDLALLRIVMAQTLPRTTSIDTIATPRSSDGEGALIQFPHIRIARSSAPSRTKLICIGHPGSEDLETDVVGVATGYEVIHVSEGVFRGFAIGQDVQDNSEIGALIHDCWTYWGHSGAPLVGFVDLEVDCSEDTWVGKTRKGSKKRAESEVQPRVVGLHSSWDDETGMRRGIGIEAIRGFLQDAGVSSSVL